MPIRLLIIDPDLQLTSRLKPAIETAGDFIVRVCATGSAALEIVQHEPQDVAVIDFDVIGMPDLVSWLREVQSGLYILVTPRTSHQAAQIPKLNVQGSVTKPYFARQIVPVIIEAAAARQRFELLKDRKSSPIIKETPIHPDDTFSRMTQAAADTTKKKADDQAVPTVIAPAITETPIPDEATIGELVSGQTSRLQPAASPPRDDATFISPPSLPEEPKAAPKLDIEEPIPETESPSVALKALVVSVDDTPLENVSVQAVVEQVNTEIVAAGLTEPGAQTQSVPVWAQPEATEPPLPVVTPEAVTSPPPAPATDPADRVAQLAAQLTQLAVDSSARGILISKGDHLIAAAGPLPNEVLTDALTAIRAVWKKQQPIDTSDPEEAKPLISYVNITGAGDFLLFSAHTVEDMTLSLLFAPETAIRTMRRQSKDLFNALTAVPDPVVEVHSVPAAVETPTPSIEPPATQTEQPADQQQEVAAPSEPTPEAAAPTKPEAATPSEPMMSYGYVWLPKGGELLDSLSETIYELLPAVAQEQGWNIDELDLRSSCVSVQVNVPINTDPIQVVETLMRMTAEHIGDGDLWADAYYIIPAERLATDQEIASFLEFHRDAFQPNR
ncbi:MAG: hypothetical protein KF716_28580 [Anaerolineae bacterium]|nr:hypothetical protein [Anaerolineae bacterium]